MKVAGVIGGGKFGLTVAKLLAENIDVRIQSRNPQLIDDINTNNIAKGIPLSRRIQGVSTVEQLAKECSLIFPVVPSAHFRDMMRKIGPHLTPSHILIHGTKGLDLKDVDETNLQEAKITRENVYTMSEVILDESCALRVGCLSGPNLASEILAGQPTATVIASEFDEVIKLGQKVLSSKRFFVFGSHDLKGAELAGAYKNVIAIASGVLAGKKLGKNIHGMLITRGLREMVYFGKVLGSSSRAFVGTSGIGDLVATANSENSRNYTFGRRLAGGEKMDEILADMEESVEGVRTLKIAEQLARKYQIHAPITNVLYRVVFMNYSIDRAIEDMMRYPFAPDVDFL